QRLEQRVVGDRLSGLLGPLRRAPATGFEQGRDLYSRIEVLHRRELRAQLGLELGAPGHPGCLQPLCRRRIEGCARRGELLADRGDAVLKLERCTRVPVRLQESPELLADVHVAYAAGWISGDHLDQSSISAPTLARPNRTPQASRLYFPCSKPKALSFARAATSPSRSGRCGRIKRPAISVSRTRHVDGGAHPCSLRSTGRS